LRYTSHLYFFHKNKITYGRLKPRNILFDRYGHIVLHYRFSFPRRIERGFTTYGGEEYLAPETLLDEKNSNSYPIDWWTFGILIYECLFGFPPFYEENINEMYISIIRSNLKFPNHKIVKFSNNIKDLIKKLLVPNPERRLGFNSSKEIKKHPFFKFVNFERVISKLITPMYQPVVKVEKDYEVKYFSDTDFSNMFQYHSDS